MGIKLIKPDGTLQLQQEKDSLTLMQEKVLKGDPGASAYEIAIANGFEGSEQEWLKSLEGAPGQTGPTGAPGKDGRDGVDGKDGYTPIKGIDYFDGEPGIDGKDGAPGEDGKDGYTPIKGVDYFDGAPGKDGEKGEPGYTPVKGVDYFDGEKGEPGYTPIKGVDYFDGEPGKDGAPGAPGKDGYTPQKGIDYFDGEPGKDGAPGKDGKDGADGYTPIKGVDYFDGEPGAQGIQGEPGKDGYTPVKGVDYFDGEPGAPGKDGKDGVDGKDGYTPVKGVDYFDGKDGKDGKSSPQFANDVSECTDTSKLYLLPDGNIWAYAQGKVEHKVNQYNPNTAKFNYRVHPNYIGTSNDPWRLCRGLVFVEIDGLDFTNKSSYIIRFNGITPVRHSAMGITGEVIFLNQSASTPWDFTGYTSYKYLDSTGTFVIQQDDEGYYVDLMHANPAADTKRCYFGVCLADNTEVGVANCQDLFIEAVPLTTYTTEYTWRDTGLAYANYVLTDSDTTIIAEKVDKKINSIMYVDGETGSNSNAGSQDSPLKTIQKAIDSGAKTIYCKAGTYNENITLNNVHGVKIIGQWEEYESGSRPKVRIDHSTTLTPTDNGNGLKTIDLPSDLYKYEHPLLYNVFVTKQYQPTMGSGINIAYIVSLWNVTDGQIATHYKLVPVMTLEECQNTEETFFYDGTTLYIHSVGSTFKMVSTSKRNQVVNCSDIVFEDIAFDYCYYDALTVNNSNGVIFRNCEFSHSSTACGVATVNMNGEFYNCEAYRNRTDGFNFHDFGETTVYNCIGAYNYDDGISHHDGCTGSIHGGQYHHNGKGGVASPTYGAVVDIYNVVMHDNKYGIYAYGGTADRQIIVNGCYIHHNTYGIGSAYDLLAMHTIITDNSTNTSGKVTVIPAN